MTSHEQTWAPTLAAAVKRSFHLWSFTALLAFMGLCRHPRQMRGRGMGPIVRGTGTLPCPVPTRRTLREGAELMRQMRGAGVPLGVGHGTAGAANCCHVRGHEKVPTGGQVEVPTGG